MDTSGKWYSDFGNIFANWPVIQLLSLDGLIFLVLIIVKRFFEIDFEEQWIKARMLFGPLRG